MASEGTRSGSTTIGAAIAGHRIARLLGGGRFGRVFECYTPDDRKVAIKLLRTKYNPLGEPLLKHVRALQQAQSPHLVQVFDVGIYSGSTYIVMEAVDGEDLATRLKRGPLRSVEALELVRQAASGLQTLWAHGLAHGDVRPANLLVTENGHLRVVDALLVPPIEGTDALRGSPEYLAPERLLGTPADVLTDIYALGCTLYELLAGQPPFEGDPTSLFDAHAHKEAPPLATSPSVADLVQRMIAKDRAQRLKTWSEVIEGVERALKGAAQAAPQRLVAPAVDVSFDEFSSELDGLDPLDSFDEMTAKIPAFGADVLGAVKDGASKEGGPKPAPAANTGFVPAPRTPPGIAPAPLHAGAPPRSAPVAPARAPSQPPAPAPVAAPAPAAARPASQPPTPARAPAGVPVVPVVPVIPVVPVAPVARPGLDEDGATVIRPMRPGVVPTAEDIGLSLDPVDE